jgi:hypothetical protein
MPVFAVKAAVSTSLPKDADGLPGPGITETIVVLRVLPYIPARLSTLILPH